MKFAVVPILLLFLGVSCAEAKSEMVLYVSNHLGFRKQDKITTESAQKILFNDIQIPKKVLPKIKKTLTTLKNMPKEKRQFCYANQYNYTLIEGNVKKEVRGCAEGKEFARIAAAFFEVQQAILKNGK